MSDLIHTRRPLSEVDSLLRALAFPMTTASARRSTGDFGIPGDRPKQIVRVYLPGWKAFAVPLPVRCGSGIVQGTSDLRGTLAGHVRQHPPMNGRNT